VIRLKSILNSTALPREHANAPDLGFLVRRISVHSFETEEDLKVYWEHCLSILQ